jgi:hypothetical protein
MTDKFQLSLAPERLRQAINPWSFYNQGAQLAEIREVKQRERGAAK